MLKLLLLFWKNKKKYQKICLIINKMLSLYLIILKNILIKYIYTFNVFLYFVGMIKIMKMINLDCLVFKIFFSIYLLILNNYYVYNRLN